MRVVPVSTPLQDTVKKPPVDLNAFRAPSMEDVQRSFSNLNIELPKSISRSNSHFNSETFFHNEITTLSQVSVNMGSNPEDKNAPFNTSNGSKQINIASSTNVKRVIIIFNTDSTYSTMQISPTETIGDTIEMKFKEIKAEPGVQAKQFGIFLKTTSDENELELHLSPNIILSTIQIQKTQQLIFKKIRPDTFPIQITLYDGSLTNVQVDIFTSVSEVIADLTSRGLIAETELHMVSLWVESSGPNNETTELEEKETPFCVLNNMAKYYIRDKTEKGQHSKIIVSVMIGCVFFRRFPIPHLCSASNVVDRCLLSFFQDASVSKKYSLCELSKPSHWKIIPDSEIISQSPESTFVLTYAKTKCFLNLDSVIQLSTKNLMEYPKKSFTGSDERKEEKNKQAADVNIEKESRLSITNITGPAKNHVQELQKSTTEESSQNEEDDEVQDLAEARGTKRITKLTSMLGIKNANEFNDFMQHSGADNAEPKSVQKVAKLLGISDDSNVKKFRKRQVAIFSTPRDGKDKATEDYFKFRREFWRKSVQDGPQIVRTPAPAVAPAFVLERKQSSGFFSKKKEPVSPNVKTKTVLVTNEYVNLRVYLVNHTYKSIQVPVDSTVDDVISMLMEKLNIKPNGEQYGLYEDSLKDGTRQLSATRSIVDIVGDWGEEENIIMFKKKPIRASVISSISASSDIDLSSSGTIQNEERRAAKVANMLGANSTKSSLKEEGVEIKSIINILKRSSSSIHKNEAKVALIQDYKEGWLSKEEIVNGKLKTSNCWCYLDNAIFSALLKDPAGKTLNTTVIPLEKCTVIKSNTRKNCIEINLTESKVTHYFIADTTNNANDWVKTLQENKKRSEKPVEVSMEDFKLQKVLGRGKFGKVLLCTKKSTGEIFAIKVIKKSIISDMRQAINTMNENKILRMIKHPYIVALHYSFMTNDRLYLVMEYVNGGELFFHINHYGKFSEERVQFYAAELYLALACLHEHGIVYRDLKLENILLDSNGHIKITDFGLCRMEEESDDDESIIAGTFEYLSPEVISGETHGPAADWWAYGVVVFEMYFGYHPFYCEEREDLFARIMSLEVDYPEYASDNIVSFLSELLIRDPERRLGTKSAMEIQHQPFLAGIDFAKLRKRELVAPFQPVIADNFDTSYFDNDFTDQPPCLTPSSGSFCDVPDKFFDGFYYNEDLEKK